MSGVRKFDNRTAVTRGDRAEQRINIAASGDGGYVTRRKLQ